MGIIDRVLRFWGSLLLYLALQQAEQAPSLVTGKMPTPHFIQHLADAFRTVVSQKSPQLRMRPKNR